MLKVDPSLDHIRCRREDVVALYESINQPLVNIPNHGTAPTYAYILGARNADGRFTVYVYLTQKDTRAVVIYVCEPRSLAREHYRAEEAEAVRFVESMGFLVDNVHFPTLPPHEQDAVMERSPLFSPPAVGTPSAEVDPTDALFGGLSEADSEVFRRAGVAATNRRPGRPEAPAAGGPRPLGAEARARVGRLLGMFILPLVLLGGCATSGTDPEAARAMESHVDLGNQQLARGLWAEAVRTFEHVLEQADDHRDALRGLGLAYLNLGRLAQAERYYRAALESDPDWSIPKNELAVVLMQQNECAEAQRLLEAVLEDIFYPTPAYAEHNLARALACQGKRQDAIRRLDNLITKRPQFCLGYLTLAQVAWQAKAHETVIAACDGFTEACEQDERIREQVTPEHRAQCYLHKGLAYAEMGDVESARAAFERCDSRGPNGRECQRSLELLPP